VINDAAAKLDDYFERLFAAKEVGPDGSDILSRLARDQINTGNMSRAEAVQIAVLLYSGGHGTTASQIGMGTLSLLQNPDQADLLRNNLDMMPAAIEEMLRFHTVTHVNSARVAIEDTEVAGHQIRKGETVYALLSAANRDPSVFPDANRFDITRDASNHVAFAFGVHQCLGQPLARLELGIVFTAILTRLPTLRLAVPFEEVRFRLRSQVYGPETLPIAW
jgi:cytochrome P450